MGCDIHTFIEVYDEEKERWFLRFRPPYSAFIEQRNYGFFADLAGVRGPGPDPKKWPVSISPQVKALTHNDDLHSHSWETLHNFLWLKLKNGELRNDPVKLELYKHKIPKEEITKLTLMETYNHEDYRTMRVVFAFDN